jgi:hypothetical protein
MKTEKLPRLSEAQIKKLTDAGSFERGQRYFTIGSIIEPILQGNELRAQCAGSRYEPYELSVTFNKQGVAEMDCSCPVGGACKHLVALLLTVVRQPDVIQRVPPLKILLAERSREELVEIIGELVKREPKLVAVIELANAGPKPGKPMNVVAYRNQARRAMSSESPQLIERELGALKQTAARLAKAGDLLNAGAIYAVALAEATRGYDYSVQEMDYDGDVMVLVDDMAEGLKDCLAQGEIGSATRREWLETLLEAYLKDIELGGTDFAPSAGDAVLELANDEEWAGIEERLRAEITGSRDWARESLIGFLTGGLEQRQREDEAVELIRELGTPEQQARLLISEGNIAEALKMIKKIIVGKPGLVTGFADSLLAANAKQEALALVLEQGSDHWNNRDWLAKYYRKHGTPREAVEAQMKLFLAAPNVETFKALREVSKKLGDWDGVRADALNKLEQERKIGALIELALHEGDVARALSLLPRVKEAPPGWFYRDYRAEVARAAEREQPEAAINIYQQLAESAIERRSRGAYQEAVEQLKRAKKLAERVDGAVRWQGYVQHLRERYPTLRALQEELSKARL